jgi:hypothetical protein
MRVPGTFGRLATGALILLSLGCMESQPSSEMPVSFDFDECGDEWLEDDNDHSSFRCDAGHYHFVVKDSPLNQSSILRLSEPADRISMSVDATLDDLDDDSGLGLGCWQGAGDIAPGYRILVGPQGWDILKEQSDGTAVSIPAHESGDLPQVDAHTIGIRADCLAGGSGTEVKIFINGTLVGTGRDSIGVDQFDVVGVMVSAAKAPLAVDFDNFHVEEAGPGA